MLLFIAALALVLTLARTSAGGQAASEAKVEAVGCSDQNQRSASPLECHSGATGAGPRIGTTVDLEAVPHAQRHRSAINAPQVGPEAVAVAEAVRHSPLTLGGHHSPQEVNQFSVEANTPVALATASSSPNSSVHFP